MTGVLYHKNLQLVLTLLVVHLDQEDPVSRGYQAIQVFQAGQKVRVLLADPVIQVSHQVLKK